MQILVRNAENLQNVERFGYSDPHVILDIEGGYRVKYKFIIHIFYPKKSHFQIIGASNIKNIFRFALKNENVRNVFIHEEFALRKGDVLYLLLLVLTV